MKRRTKYTAKQKEILNYIRDAEHRDHFLDFDELLDLLSWAPSKESAQFSIRAMIRRKLIEKLPEHEFRRERFRVCYRLGTDGKLFFNPFARV